MIRGRLIIRGEDYSLGNIFLDLFSHRFSQIFCCLGNSCLQMSGCVVRRNKSVFICVICGSLIHPWGWYSLGNISLDLFSHRLHRFSQIFCCLGNSCLQMSGCVVRRNKSVFICVICGSLIHPWGWYSLGNISLDLFSHRLHRFSQIFCCLGNSCLQMSGCVVRMEKICVSSYRPPLTPPEVGRTGLSDSWKVLWSAGINMAHPIFVVM